MEVVILCICLMLLAILLGILIGILIMYARDDDSKNNGQGRFDATVQASGIQTYAGTVQPYSGTLQQYSSTTAYGRIWHIELWNIKDGKAYSKDFCGQIMIGRGGNGTELFWQMRVGEDPTISREQCVIYDRGGFLVIENVGQVNITLVNGVAATTPYMLQQGYQITMGRSNYILSAIQRMA